MAGAVITGVVGAIQWAYYHAATIEGYTVIGIGPKPIRRWRLSARVVMRDPFKLSRRPLMFVAPHAGGVWRWPIVQVDQVGDRLTAELGPVEGR